MELLLRLVGAAKVGEAAAVTGAQVGLVRHTGELLPVCVCVCVCVCVVCVCVCARPLTRFRSEF